MSEDLLRLSATEALARLRTGALTAETYARAHLDRIALRDGEVRAWSFIDPDAVIARARALDASPDRGPLHGLPVAIKDVILTADMPTQYNSPIYQGFAPPVDAACIKILRAAGALLLGKTDTVEFAASGTRAATRNPLDLDRTPGASSSGSAAAVADFHAPLALGTQTGGSTIRPASFCGLYAIKPTWNLVSAEGLKTFAVSLDTLGWFARSAEDLGLLYDVFDPEDGATPPLDLANARIGVYHTTAWDRAEPATRDAMDTAVAALEGAGAQVVELDLPAPFDQLIAAQRTVTLGEGRAAFLSEYRSALPLLEASLRGHVENVEGLSRRDLVNAYDIAAACRRTFDAVAADYDAVLAPSALGEAPLGLANTGDWVFNGVWTLLHTPVVNVPGLTGPAGMPVGVSLTGRRFSDRKVLAAAKALGRLLA